MHVIDPLRRPPQKNLEQFQSGTDATKGCGCSTTTTAVLPWRATSDTHTYADSNEERAAYDRHEPASGKSPQWTWRGTPRYCGKFWSAASTCSMVTRHSMTESSLSTRASSSHMMVQASAHASFECEKAVHLIMSQLANQFASALSFPLRTGKMSTPGRVRDQEDQ